MSVSMGTSTRYLRRRRMMLPPTYSTPCIEYQFTAGKFTKPEPRLVFKNDQSSLPCRLAGRCTLRR
jgi:hypothetical protein